MDICKTTDLKKLEKKVRAIDMRLKAQESKEKETVKK
jgi:hypothetical protein